MPKTYTKSPDGLSVIVENSIKVIESRTLEDVDNDIAGLQARITDLQTERAAIVSALNK